MSGWLEEIDTVLEAVCLAMSLAEGNRTGQIESETTISQSIVDDGLITTTVAAEGVDDSDAAQAILNSNDNSNFNDSNPETSTDEYYYYYEDLDVAAAKDPSAFCVVARYIDDITFYRCVLVPAAVILLILSFFLHRRRLGLHCCNGRPGFLFPLNFLDQRRHRFSFVAAFVLAGLVMVNIVTGGPLPFYSFETIPYSTPIFALFACVQYAFVYYPIFAALTSQNVFGFFLGGVYTWLLLIMFFLNERFCGLRLNPKSVMSVVRSLPPLLCLIYLSIMLPYRGFDELCRSHETRVRAANIMFLPEAQYIKSMLKEKDPPGPDKKLTWKQRLRNYIYVSTPHFRYSVSILTGTTMACCFAFMISVSAVDNFYQSSKDMLASLDRKIESSVVNGTVSNAMLLAAILLDVDPIALQVRLLEDGLILIHLLEASLYTSVALIFINAVVCAFLTLKSYKRNMIMIYKGQQHDIPKAAEYTPKTLLLYSVRYVGYQTAYATWGFLLQTFTLCIVFWAICIIIFLAIRYDNVDIIVMILERIWAAVSVLVFLLITQKILVLFFTLKDQHGERVLAVDNRRFFFNFQYFSVFANTAVGFVSCLVRIGKSVVIGLFVLSRLDMSVLNRHFEWMDPGFMSYVGLLYMENAHRNPILMVASAFLAEAVSNAKMKDAVTMFEKVPTFGTGTKSYKRARNRWCLAYTLHNNPGLRLHRKLSGRPTGLFYINPKLVSS